MFTFHFEDFNKNLLHADTMMDFFDFLLYLQSVSFIPTLDKPTLVYNYSATLIDKELFMGNHKSLGNFSTKPLYLGILELSR